MARSVRSGNLETRTSRLKLPARWKPYTARVAPGIRLAYRRNATAGRWSVMAADGKGGSWMKAFADADDHEIANGETVLDFWQAQDRARILARGESGADAASDSTVVTVGAAVDAYKDDLKIRSADAENVARIRTHLTKGLREKPVALLTGKELRHWRNGLAKTLAPASINRVCNAFRAALNLAADTDQRIINRRAWKFGLEAIEGASKSRNVILSEATVRRIVAESYAIGPEFGLLVEVAATTGARVSQLARLEVQDVQGDRALRLMMPSSKKGKGKKKIVRRPVSIPEGLLMRLRQTTAGRSASERLLVKPSGEPWAKSDHSRLFRRAAASADLDPQEVTLYALRHSNIVRQLLAREPIRVVAMRHDTSVAMIEANYSDHILDHADELSQSALLDLSPLAGADAKVVPFDGVKAKLPR